MIIPLTSRGRKFTEEDAFIGYQKDIPVAVVLQATHQLRWKGPAASSEWRRMELASVPADEEEEVEEESHAWKEDVRSIVLCARKLWSKLK